MQNIIEILKEIGIEIPEENTSKFNELFSKNYRTIVDYQNVSARRDELTASRAEIERLAEQVRQLTDDLTNERQSRQDDAARNERENKVSSFLADKKFVNPLTASAVKQQLLDKLIQNSGESIEQIYAGITTGEDGQPIPNIEITDNGVGALPKFTAPATPIQVKQPEKSDILNIKDSRERQSAIAKNLSLFVKEKQKTAAEGEK